MEVYETMKLELQTVYDSKHGNRYIIYDASSKMVYEGHERWSAKGGKIFARRDEANRTIEWLYKQEEEIKQLNSDF